MATMSAQASRCPSLLAWRKSDVAVRRVPSGTLGNTTAAPMTVFWASRNWYAIWPLRSERVRLLRVTLSRQPLLDGRSSWDSTVRPLLFGPVVELSSQPRVRSSSVPMTPALDHLPPGLPAAHPPVALTAGKLITSERESDQRQRRR